MIRVTITLSKEGVIERLSASGHAGGVKGSDVVCSAFTILLRTFVRCLESSSKLDWSVETDQPNEFEVKVAEVKLPQEAEYRGWCGFLLRGVDDLQNDSPQGVALRVIQSQRGVFHGT